MHNAHYHVSSIPTPTQCIDGILLMNFFFELLLLLALFHQQKESKISGEENNENEKSKSSNGNFEEGSSCSPDQRKLLLNNNNNNINNNNHHNNNINNSKNLDNNGNDIEPKDDLKNGDSLLRNHRYRFGSSKTLSREDDRILKEMVNLTRVLKCDFISPATKTHQTVFISLDFPICNRNADERPRKILSRLF